VYFTEGDKEEAKLEDYHSHNTRRMDLREMEELLLSLPEVQEELKDWKA
jgi:UDP-glucose 4-epimerase